MPLKKNMYVTYIRTCKQSKKKKIVKVHRTGFYSIPLFVLFLNPLHAWFFFENLAQIKGEGNNEENIESFIGI